MRLGVGLAALLALWAPAFAHAERPAGVCVEVAVDFTPADMLQIAAWLEKPDGTFVDTVYLTQKVGRYGMGNRPGISDFNTGSLHGDTFPYGRREQTFPVWAHRHGMMFPLVVFQNGDERNLSHPFAQSSTETPPPYCRPIQPTEVEFDSGTCASATFTDKGVFAPEPMFSRYPPRSDLMRRVEDSPSVDLFRGNNPFDSVTRATPIGGMPATVVWAAPQSVDYGSYVLFVEAHQTYDFNATYNAMTYPSPPGIPWADYGKPWRGQPSIIYSVPFSIAESESRATTSQYVGYGDITGETGTLNPPDATITTDTPGSGASRMQLVSDGSEMFRVRVRSKPEIDTTAPGTVDDASLTRVGATAATIAFTAPGDDGTSGKLAGYEIRIRSGSRITEANFDDATPIAALVTPTDPGGSQSFEITGLLPDNDYSLGIRPYDNCFNRGAVSVVSFTTVDQDTPEVPWCFIATAAYGSTMAKDVTLLRSFRDSHLTTTVLGELMVETYYTFSPVAAGVIRESELLRASARAILGPIIDWVRTLTYRT